MVGAEVRSHGPNGEKRSYIVEDFQLTIPKRCPQKRTRPAIEGPSRPDPFRNGGADDRHGTQDVQAPVARGLIRGETQTLEASGGTWHFIHRDFEWLTYAQVAAAAAFVTESRWGGPDHPPDPRNQRTRMPAEQQPRFPNMAACAICGRRRVPRDRERPRCSRKVTPISGHGAGRARAVSSCTWPVSGLPL